MHIYGTRETSYILTACQPKVHVTASRFGHQDYLANLESMPELPEMQVIVLDEPGPAGSLGFAELLAADPLPLPWLWIPQVPRLWGGPRVPRRARRAWSIRIKLSVRRSRSSVRPLHRQDARR